MLISMEDKILKMLRESRRGLSIAELAKKLRSSRFIVRKNLARLEWEKKVSFEQIGMAKLYFLEDKK
jgi:transcriptional regulator of NAD metabolism